MTLPVLTFSAHRPRSTRRLSRAALFGATALALGTALSGSAVATQARAESALIAPTVNPSGPVSFADMVDRVKGAVVAIKVKAVEREEGGGMEMPDLSPDDPLYRFFKRFEDPGHGGRPQTHMTMSQGSGFIISGDGYVVTNNHVVENAKEVEVALDNGKSVAAKVIGTDKRTDLALLKISESGTYPYVEFSSTPPRVGDWIVAVGNPFGLGGTVTAGIVSARGRDIGAGPYDDFLQIDAPVNRGNSGGPTFDSRGAVVGVNTAIYSPSGGSVGIGFAIPAEVAKDVIVALKDKGYVARGWIGVQIQNVTQDIADSLGLKNAKGALVANPQRNSPAEAAGLKSGDVITSVDNEKIDNARELARKIAALGPGKTVEIVFLRNGADKSTKIKLGTLPNEKERPEVGALDRTPSATLAAIGIEVAPAAELRGGGDGLVVTAIDPSGAAAQKGMRRGDVILEAGGQTVNASGELAAAFEAAKKEGRRSVLLRVKSAEGTRFVAVGLGSS